MGFLSTFTVEHKGLVWPDWFKEKYAKYLTFSMDSMIAPVREMKMYMPPLSELPEDIRRAIDWEGNVVIFVMCFLHECEGITRCHITRDAIRWSEPTAWAEVEEVSHHYCYGCSDIDVLEKNEDSSRESKT